MAVLHLVAALRNGGALGRLDEVVKEPASLLLSFPRRIAAQGRNVARNELCVHRSKLQVSDNSWLPFVERFRTAR